MKNYSRRDFIKTSAAAGAAVRLAGFDAWPAGGQAEGGANRLITFTDWMRADREARKRAVEQCLARIRELDPKIRAWVAVQPEPPTGDGALSEIPFGVKDIVETKGMATEYGSPLYKGRVGTEDAAIVRDLRARGAILLGKTVTTAFAYRTPGPTHNPLNLDYTPGGSSSGSAAAVAADMVPFAVGEQTRGSMLRPASFCGVTGFKPTHDLLSMEGVLLLSKSLDTLGLFTHTPADTLALWKAMGHDVGREEEFPVGIADPIPECDPEMANAFRKSVDLLRSGGVSIKNLDIADLLKKLDAANDTLMFYEGARTQEPRLKEFGDKMDAPLAALIRDGLKIPEARYNEAQQFVAEGRAYFAGLFKSTPVILTPAAPGPAPMGLSTTGDPRMNAPWTALWTPAISIPMPLAAGLPLGMQMTADLGQDARLIRAAVRLHAIFAAGPKIAAA
jgi:Asp-tRNA(Asn)/Glu-tRNA(Gln) amidotransferase A subunit family amidase